MPESYLIIIPAYNEEENIAKVISDVRERIPFADILVVNDGSMDTTSGRAMRSGVMVVDIPFNIGYGGAIQTGFRFAEEYGYDFVFTMDGDAQHDPSSVQNLLDAMEEEGADIVIGSRFLEGTYRMGIARKIGVLVFSAIAQFYTGTTFTDPTSGFQLLNRKVFSYLSQGDNYPLDYPDVNIIMALHKLKFKVVETPVRMLDRPRGKSMHSGLRPFVYVLRMFLAILMVLIRKED
jgi:glycosyltransferase involved in cell wall biosynthesis